MGGGAQLAMALMSQVGRRRSHALVGLAVALVAGGCRYHVEADALKTYIKRPETCVEAVTVYERPEDVKRRFVPLAELSLWAPGDMVVTPESEVEAQQRTAATWGANGLVLRHPRNALQLTSEKTVAIFVPADSALAMDTCARVRAGR
jgi:hypothetical protein